MDYPLMHAMPDGPLIKDYIGTAAVAANVAGTKLTAVRNQQTSDPIAAMDSARDQLTQALDEVEKVIVAAAHLKAYGPE